MAKMVHRISVRESLRPALVAISMLAAMLVPSIGGISMASASTPTTTAALTCEDYWLNSGHTANVDWYHCHRIPNRPNSRRVHICGLSGILHGITVTISSTGITTSDHAHDPGGEGCG
jgi:hypothetical protein